MGARRLARPIHIIGHVAGEEERAAGLQQPVNAAGNFAIDERFGADEGNIRMQCRLVRRTLAAPYLLKSSEVRPAILLKF
jgi:hypothetical protein